MWIGNTFINRVDDYKNNVIYEHDFGKVATRVLRCEGQHCFYLRRVVGEINCSNLGVDCWYEGNYTTLYLEFSRNELDEKVSFLDDLVEKIKEKKITMD